MPMLSALLSLLVVFTVAGKQLIFYRWYLVINNLLQQVRFVAMILRAVAVYSLHQCVFGVRTK